MNEQKKGGVPKMENPPPPPNKPKMLKDEVAEQMEKFIGPLRAHSAIGGRILEIGTGWGESAEFLSSLKPTWKIYTVDGFGLYGDGRIYPRLDHDQVERMNAKIIRCGNVIQILGDSARIPWELPIDAFFHDGDHRYEGVKKDWERYGRWIVKGGLAIFDDYTQPNYPANGVARFVNEILTVDPSHWQPVYIGYYCAILQKTKQITATELFS